MMALAPTPWFSILTCLAAAAAAAAPSAAPAAAACTDASYPHNISRLQLKGGTYFPESNVSPAACRSSCCARPGTGSAATGPKCTAWQYHMSSTDPSHHPKECWLSFSDPPEFVGPSEQSDVWVGGATAASPGPPPAPHHTGGGGGSTGGGASIEPMSSWYYYGGAGNLAGTLNRELTDQSIVRLHARAAGVAALSADKAKWQARQQEVYSAFGGGGAGPFAPLPPPNRSPPKYRVTKTLSRPGYTCELIIFPTRPGFFATASLWTPAKLKTVGGKAPGVLMVSGHTSDGFRSNNLGGPAKQNDPPDDGETTAKRFHSFPCGFTADPCRTR